MDLRLPEPGSAKGRIIRHDIETLPRQLDIAWESDGRKWKWLGIYRWEGERLVYRYQVCDQNDGVRPTSFEIDPADPRHMGLLLLGHYSEDERNAELLITTFDFDGQKPFAEVLRAVHTKYPRTVTGQKAKRFLDALEKWEAEAKRLLERANQLLKEGKEDEALNVFRELREKYTGTSAVSQPGAKELSKLLSDRELADNRRDWEAKAEKEIRPLIRQAEAARTALDRGETTVRVEGPDNAPPRDAWVVYLGAVMALRKTYYSQSLAGQQAHSVLTEWDAEDKFREAQRMAKLGLSERAKKLLEDLCAMYPNTRVAPKARELMEKSFPKHQPQQ